MELCTAAWTARKSCRGLPTRLHTAPQNKRRWRLSTVSTATTATDDQVTHRLQITDEKWSGSGVTRTARWPQGGRAAVDEATRNILTRTSGRGNTLAGCLPARKGAIRLWRSLRHRFHRRLCEAVSAWIHSILKIAGKLPTFT